MTSHAGSNAPHAGSNLPIHPVDPKDIEQAYGPGGKPQLAGAQPASLSSSSFSTVYLWRGYGRANLPLPNSMINAGSRVVVSVSEYATQWNIDRFIGSAAVQVLNVSPYNGGVYVWLNVSWNYPLNICITVMVDP